MCPSIEKLVVSLSVKRQLAKVREAVEKRSFEIPQWADSRSRRPRFGLGLRGRFPKKVERVNCVSFHHVGAEELTDWEGNCW